MLELTNSQQELVEKVRKWFHNWENGIRSGPHPQYITYTGRAGSGKTVVAQSIVKDLGLTKNEYVATAYVGKAVMRLQQTNLPAKTIHSLIYRIIPTMKLDEKTNRKYLSFSFELKESLDPNYRLIIVDEATMVNEELQKELLSFGLPIIFMGDKNQLPPVFGISSIMNNPDHELTEIMRQKEDDPIVILANMVLNDVPLLEGQYGKSSVIRGYQMTKSILTDFDQVICVTNKLRSDINNYVRFNLKGYRSLEPKLHDKIMCRQNNWQLNVDGFNLTNGMVGHITDISRHSLSKGYYTLDFKPDFFEEGQEFLGLHVDAKYLTSPYEEQKIAHRLKYEKFEYAYAITAYTAQGSEWDRVLYFDSWFRDADLTKKSRYTSITRAKEAITIVTGKMY